MMSPMLFTRPDGTRLRDLDPMRRMLPMLMPTRNEAAVYYEQIVDATALTAFLERWNAGPGPRLTPLHLVVASLGRLLVARPALDRFVAGGGCGSARRRRSRSPRRRSSPTARR